MSAILLLLAINLGLNALCIFLVLDARNQVLSIVLEAGEHCGAKDSQGGDA